MADTDTVRRRKVRAKDVFQGYFLKHHRTDLLMILEAEDESEHYPVIFNFLTLFEEHVEVAEALLASPIKLLPVLDSALVLALRKLLDEIKDKNDLNFKSNVHARITGLPTCPELYRHAVPRTCDVGRLLCVSGTVVRTTAAKMLEYQKEFICVKCKHVFTVKADHDQYYQLNKPGRCPNPIECYSYNFNLLDTSSHLLHTKDYQEIKIQEQVQKLVIGTIPRSLWVTLEDDLVGACKPGDDVLLCGTVHRRWRPVVRDSRPDIDLVFKANNVTVRNKQRSGAIVTDEMRDEFNEFWEKHKYNPLGGRNIILASFCPQVYGLYVVKLAVAVVVAGGVQKADNVGTRVRGESHLLLVGDPGTGKSQFLKYVCSLVPRCVLTTGIGTTNAGLTVSAVRDEGEWALEAGALVLADGGICCIDEFNNVREADRAAIHEAMEQQTISVAKAGLVCKLNSRCSVIAATNPKGHYNPEESITVNVALASPLLSRFDLILVLLDTRNQDWDRIVSGYILEGVDPLAGDSGSEEDWKLDKLQAYFCHIRSIQPIMTPAANIILAKYYQMQRQTDQRSQARTTIRLLESLVRLSQGHAKLMMRSEVTLQDAVVAVTMMEASMSGSSLINGINPLHTAFPRSPREEYKTQAKIILQNLKLFDLLTQEMNRLNEEEHLYRNCSVSNTKVPPKKKSDPSHGKTFSSSIRYTSKSTFKPSVNDDKTPPGIEELEETEGLTRKKKQRTMDEFSKKMDESVMEDDSDASCENSSGAQRTIGCSKDESKKNKKRKADISGTNKKFSSKELHVKREKKTKNSSSDATESSQNLIEMAGKDLLDDLDDFCDEKVSPSVRNGKFKSIFRLPGKQSIAEGVSERDAVSGKEVKEQSKSTCKRKGRSEIDNEEHKPQRSTKDTEAESGPSRISKREEDSTEEIDIYFDSPEKSQTGKRKRQSSVESDPGSEMLNISVQHKFHIMESAGKNDRMQFMKLMKTGNKETNDDEDCLVNKPHTVLGSQTDLQSQIDKAGEELLDDIDDFFDPSPSSVIFRPGKTSTLSKFRGISSKIASIEDKSNNVNLLGTETEMVEREQNKENDNENDEDKKSKLNSEIKELTSNTGNKENKIPKATKKECGDDYGCENELESSQTSNSGSDTSSSSIGLFQRFAFTGRNNENKKILSHLNAKQREIVEGPQNSDELGNTANGCDSIGENEKVVSSRTSDIVLQSAKTSCLTKINGSHINTKVAGVVESDDILNKSNNEDSSVIIAKKSMIGDKLNRFSFALGGNKNTSGSSHDAASEQKPLPLSAGCAVKDNNKLKNADILSSNKSDSSVTKFPKFVLPYKRPSFRSSQGSSDSHSSSAFVGGAAASSEDLDDIDFELNL